MGILAQDRVIVGGELGIELDFIGLVTAVSESLVERLLFTGDTTPELGDERAR